MADATAAHHRAAPRRRHTFSWSLAVQRAMLAMLLAVLLLAWPVGCTTTIIPPTTPADPVDVYLLDHGHTPSLILPTPDGQLVRYAYGDWRYYALGQRGMFAGLRALCWPTQGTLGRSDLHGPPVTDIMLQQIRVPVSHLYIIPVERETAYQLHAILEQQYRDQRDTEVANPPAGLDFVHHPDTYTWFYNSNHAVADWLRQLDCDVRGPAFISSWQVLKSRP